MTNMRWTGKLKRIERAFDGLPSTPSAAAQRVRLGIERRAQERREKRLTAAGTWARVVLIAALAAGIQFLWPYSHSCGTGLLEYLAAQCAVVGGGLWASCVTWRARIALAHVAALMVMLWGLGLVAIQILPRLASGDRAAVHAFAWRCAIGK